MSEIDLQAIADAKRKELGIISSTEAPPKDNSFEAMLERMKSRPAFRREDPPPPTPEQLAAREKAGRKSSWERIQRCVGPVYADCTLDNYRIAHPGQHEVVEALRHYAAGMVGEIVSGNGIVLFGGSGTGKDHLLVAMSRMAILEHGVYVHWCHGLDLYGEMRDRIANDKAEQEWIEDLASHQVLYLSDPIPPGGALTPFQASMLERILDLRVRNRRPVWASLNVRSSAEADALMGPALVDRLKPGSIGAYCDWPSHRKIRMVWTGKPSK